MTAWTRQKPTKPGWYWHKRDGVIQVVRVTEDRSFDGTTLLWGTGLNDRRLFSFSSGMLGNWEGEFFGPLEVPA